MDTKYTSKTILDILSYIYTGSVEFPKLTAAQILNVQYACVEFELPRLSYLCENYLRNNLNTENIYTIIRLSHFFDLKTIKEYTVHYAVSNYQLFTQHKQGVLEIGPDLFKTITDMYNQSVITPIKTPSPLIEPINTIIEDFKTIFTTMNDSDASFLINNELIATHKCILAGHSDELQSLCMQNPIKNKEGNYVYVVPLAKSKDGTTTITLSPEGFRSLLRYIYYGDENLQPMAAIELIPYAKDLTLPEFMTVCEQVAFHNITITSALPILIATYMDQMSDREAVAKELRKNAIDFIISHFYEIDLSNIKNLNPDLAIDILLAQQSLLKLNEKGVDSSSETKTKQTLALPDLSVPSLR